MMSVCIRVTVCDSVCVFSQGGFGLTCYFLHGGIIGYVIRTHDYGFKLNKSEPLMRK